MDELLAHLQQYALIYLTGSICFVFFVYLTKKYSLPIIQWGIELAIYCSAFHIFLHYFVSLVKWFKLNTTMYWHEKVDPGWTTPLLRFWDRQEYVPEWIFYFEVIVALLMLAAMIRYRPMKVQRIKPRREVIRKGSVPESLRQHYRGQGFSNKSSGAKK